MIDDGDEKANDRRRRLLKGAGSIAGGLAVAGAIPGSADAFGSPIAGGGPLPLDERHADRNEPPEEPSSNPDDGAADRRYLELVAEQIGLRDNNTSTMDTAAIRAALRERNGEFDGHLVFFAASDFGRPVVFLPEGLSDPDGMLNAVLDRIHERKWRAENERLRSVRHEIFDRVRGIHKGLPALCYDDGTADYDIVYGWQGVYNFLTIRQVAGLVDWMANAGDRWDDGLRIEY